VLMTSRLREQITLQRRTVGRDDRGQALETWLDVETVFAAAEPLRGRDYFAAGQMQASLVAKFTIRFRTDVQASWRVLWRGEAYEVQGPPIDVRGQREVLELMCSSGTGDAR